MLGKLVVVATDSARLRASSTNRCGGGWSLATIASPPSNWRASRARPRSSRSAKNPTAVSADTASVTASSSRRNSPARKSRWVWRQARDQRRGRGAAGMGGYEGRKRNGTRSRIPPAESPERSVQPGAMRGTGLCAPMAA